MPELFSMGVQGFEALDAKLAQLGERGPVAVEGGLFEAGSLILGDSQELVPVDTGTLRNSGFVVTPTLDNLLPGAEPAPEARSLATRVGEVVRCVVGYGGLAVRYALAVHENPRSGKTGGRSPSGKKYTHWARVGQWKYLETAANQNAAKVAPLIAARVDRELAQVARGTA